MTITTRKKTDTKANIKKDGVETYNKEEEEKDKDYC